MAGVLPMPTRLESPQEVFSRVSAREQKLSRLLIFYISGGLLFMLLPGTFLGVWNLISISAQRTAGSVSPAWIQAHGHAQVLGWIGSFILGIGYYSIPKLRQGSRPFALWSAWFAGFLWMTGVLLRWIANVYLWQWQMLLPLSAAFELAAFLMVFRAVSQHKPTESGKHKLEIWIFVVIAGTLGLLATLLLNFGGCLWLSLRAAGPAFPQGFDQRFLIAAAWAFMVPFVWGFSAKWLPVFLGTHDPNNRWLGAAVAINITSIGFGMAGAFRGAAPLFVLSALSASIALQIFTRPKKPAKTRGVHGSFPFFVRSAYVWLMIAALLGVWAANAKDPTGLWGASRHALTVGFVSMMVFCVGQRVLPAFSGMRLLFSTRLMFVSLLLLTCGCLARVAGEVLAYQGIMAAAWSWLPYSAILELSAVTAFAFNLTLTFMQKPVSRPSVVTQIHNTSPKQAAV